MTNNPINTSQNNSLSQNNNPSSKGVKNKNTLLIYILLLLNLVLLTRLSLTFFRDRNQDITASIAAFKKPDEHEPEGDDNPVDFWLKMALIVFLVMIGGIFAGLTIGLMGLDETNLHVLMASGTPTEQVHAEIVYSLLSRGKHWVLVTLLLGNVIVNETLPVVLDSELGGGVVAILISTMLIVVFGEIIPQAVCARYGLAIGSYCAKPMLVLMYFMSPVAYPIAMLLDSWLGVHHGTTYRRTELKTLVSLHQVDGIGELTDDEVTIIASVLDLKEKSVLQIMTPLEDVFTLSEDAVLDEELMEQIVSAGYSRIPIYRHDDPNNFIGMLLVKRLITYDPEDHITVRQFAINSLPEVPPNTSCLDILNFFQEGRSHMAMVTSDPGGFGDPVGVITLEDVIEELLGEEIVDESDVYVDVHNKIKVIRKPIRNTSMIKSLKTLLRSPAVSNVATPLIGQNEPSAAPAKVLSDTKHDKNLVIAKSLVEHDMSLTVPISVENHNSYMSTGKTILQPRNASFDMGNVTLPIQDGDRTAHDCAFKTGATLNNFIHQQLQSHTEPPNKHSTTDANHQVSTCKPSVTPEAPSPSGSTLSAGTLTSTTEGATTEGATTSEGYSLAPAHTKENNPPRRSPQALDGNGATPNEDETISIAPSTVSSKKKKKKKKSK
ncbi:hypothetical protein BGZ76_010610 [Entomortierella beljakovae]|nr:hypothetical protein BGZ76_010610 [Entomortierella beljakovae]